MMEYKAIAKSDLLAYPHTWTKGLDYQLVQKDGYFILASNEGSINYSDEVKDQALEEFKVI